MIDDRFTIGKNYLSGWFLCDFLSIFPFELVLVDSFEEDYSQIVT